MCHKVTREKRARKAQQNRCKNNSGYCSGLEAAAAPTLGCRRRFAGEMADTTAAEHVFARVNLGEDFKQWPIGPRGINPPLAVVAHAIKLRMVLHIQMDVIIPHF